MGGLWFPASLGGRHVKEVWTKARGWTCHVIYLLHPPVDVPVPRRHWKLHVESGEPQLAYVWCRVSSMWTGNIILVGWDCNTLRTGTTALFDIESPMIGKEYPLMPGKEQVSGQCLWNNECWVSHKSIHMKNQNALKKLILRKVSGDALLLHT